MTDQQVEPAADGQRRPVLGLLAANAVSAMGNATSSVALAWFVLETTGSAALMGIAAAAISIGGVFASVLGGPVVDRLGLKRVSIGGDLGAAIAVALIPALHLAGILTFWQLVVLAFLMSAVNTQGDTARFALMPLLANRADMTMERANSADRAIARGAQIAGPLLAGVLIALIGPVNVLFFNAATYVLSATIVAFAVPRAATVVREAEAPRAGYVAELREGLRFVRGNRLILSLVLVSTLANFLDIPLFSVIMPVYAQTFYGTAASLGVLLSAIAGGALVGTLIFAAVGRNWPRRRTFLLALVVAPALFYTALAVTPALALLVVLAALAGGITGPVTPVLLTVVQSETPPELSGRVFGALSAIAGLGVPIGSVLWGLAIEGFGLIPTIVAMGVIYVVAVGAMSLNPALRGMDRQPVAEPIV
jgi:MFS family permease